MQCLISDARNSIWNARWRIKLVKKFEERINLETLRKKKEKERERNDQIGKNT